MKRKYYEELGKSLEKFMKDENNSITKYVWGDTQVIKVEHFTIKQLIEWSKGER